MRLHYSVSWQEYLDFCKAHFPRPDWAFSVASVLASIAMIIVAVAADSIGHGRGISEMAVLSAIGLLVLGFWSPTIGTLIRRWQYRRRCRSNFQERLDGNQEFTFDDQKWGTEHGEEQWSNTLYAMEDEKFIVIESGESFALLPKRVLSREMLAQLRERTFGSFHSPVTFDVCLRDYIQAEIRSLWIRRRSGMLIAHATAVLLSIMMFTSLRRPHATSDTHWMMLLATCLLFITASTPYFYFLARYLTRWRPAYDAWEMEWSERGAHVRHGDSEFFGDWSVFPTFEETKRSFLLYANAEEFYILPKSGLEPRQQHGLREMLLAKVGFA